jgi:hypothetical protein
MCYIATNCYFNRPFSNSGRIFFTYLLAELYGSICNYVIAPELVFTYVCVKGFPLVDNISVT